MAKTSRKRCTQAEKAHAAIGWLSDLRECAKQDGHTGNAEGYKQIIELLKKAKFEEDQPRSSKKKLAKAAPRKKGVK